MKFFCAYLYVISVFVTTGYGYSILGVFHTTSKSHHTVGSALMLELASRGHQVTTISPFRLNSPVKNYTEIIVDGSNSEATKIDLLDSCPIRRLINLDWYGSAMSEATLQSRAFKEFLEIKPKFDLIIIDLTMSEVMFGLGHHFNAPIIGLSTPGAAIWASDLVGSPAPLSYVPVPGFALTNEMDYFERILNVIRSTVYKFYYKFVYLPGQNELYNTYFRDPKPSLQDLRKNVSLVLVNSHFTLHYSRPSVPNMIDVGGLHVHQKSKPLPKEIQEFMDSAKNGVIYFSLDSNSMCRDFNNATWNTISRVLSDLHEKVIWNCDLPRIGQFPENVLTKTGVPQNAILAHPNLKIFVTHGGLLSTTEAIYHGIPMIGISKYGDQIFNMAFAVQAKFAVQIDFNDLNEYELSKAINEVLMNPEYREKAKIWSEKFRDQPLSPLDTAVYWVEYVIRHKGAPHMRVKGQDLSFSEYHSLDTLGFLIGAVMIFSFISIKIVKRVFIFCVLFYLNLNVKEKIQ